MTVGLAIRRLLPVGLPLWLAVGARLAVLCRATGLGRLSVLAVPRSVRLLLTRILAWGLVLALGLILAWGNWTGAVDGRRGRSIC
jgi:hypothetical protein